MGNLFGLRWENTPVLQMSYDDPYSVIDLALAPAEPDHVKQLIGKTWQADVNRQKDSGEHVLQMSR